MVTFLSDVLGEFPPLSLSWEATTNQIRKRYFGCGLGHPSQTPVEKKSIVECLFFSFTHCAPNKVSMRPIVISWWNLIELASESLFDRQIIKKVYRLCSAFIPSIDCRKIKVWNGFFSPIARWRKLACAHSLWVDCAWATTVCLINWCVRAVNGDLKQQAENRLFARESFGYYLKSSTPANSR